MVEILKNLLQTQIYIVITTKYTIHHIEKLSPSCKDRGKWKWIAEPIQPNQYENQQIDEEARLSHIDQSDLFPRLFFNDFCIMSEILSFLSTRGLNIIDIKCPKF
jgi:hypothetical protein